MIYLTDHHTHHRRFKHHHITLIQLGLRVINIVLEQHMKKSPDFLQTLIFSVRLFYDIICIESKLLCKLRFYFKSMVYGSYS